MRVPIYQLDAFTERTFGGNPAAVCPLESWLEDATLQAIAMENNLSETAFFVPRDDGDYDLRWFTPALEVDLCGHATLATAALILRRLAPERDGVAFMTRSGRLSVARTANGFAMDFPADPPVPAEPPADLEAILGGGAASGAEGALLGWRCSAARRRFAPLRRISRRSPRLRPAT